MSGFTSTGVLAKARGYLRAGPLPTYWAEHGPYCVWCACAKAKGELDDEHGTSVGFAGVRAAGPTIGETIVDGVRYPVVAPSAARFYGENEPIPLEVVEVPSDTPLVEACKRLSKWNDTDPSTLTAATALAILDEVLEGVTA